MIIRPFEGSDLKSLAALHSASKAVAEKGIIYDSDLAIFTPDYYMDRWGEWTQNPEMTLYVATDEHDDIQGFISFGKVKTRPDFDRGVVPRFGAEIYALYVHPEHLQKGVGKALFIKAIHDLIDQKLTSLILWALKKNKRACGFYEAMGGERIAKKRIDIGEKSWAEESCFAWRDIRKITRSIESGT